MLANLFRSPLDLLYNLICISFQPPLLRCLVIFIFRCWLSRIAFYAAFLGPVVLLMIINSVVFVFVMRQIINRSSNKLTKTEKSSTVVRLRGAISVIILLGLTWIFAIFAVGDFGIVFHYLFAILNSMQGLFIFFFYCFLKNDVRNLWRRKFTCLKSPYEADTATKSNDRGNVYIFICSTGKFNIFCLFV